MSPLPRVCRWRACATAFAAALLAALPLRPAAAQATRTLTACTPDALTVCAELRLTSGPSLFEFGTPTVATTGQPALPVSIHDLLFGTGSAAAVSPLTVNVIPMASEGATLGDASPWELFDACDALFLAALANFGVCGCAAGAPVDGFGQAPRTCGAGRFVTFRFAPTNAFDLRRFTLLNLKVVALTSPSHGASRGAAGSACRITADVTTPGTPLTTVPEPATIALVGTGLPLTGVTTAARRRRA